MERALPVFPGDEVSNFIAKSGEFSLIETSFPKNRLAVAGAKMLPTRGNIYGSHWQIPKG